MREFTKGRLEHSSAGHGWTGKGLIIDEYFIRRPEDDVALAADVIDPETGKPSEENARRLVACWNACEGIPTDALEKGRISSDAFQLKESRGDAAEQHCEELLIALIESRDVISTALKTGAPDWFDSDEAVSKHTTVQKIDAAIAKATQPLNPA
ncbi:hypothetical protein [Pseudomonas sp. LS-2]|uniref:hypothetical protein n=1 Tax=Pseudomonas sp. LS-2 TaxID=2315859 RepID=UPI001058BBE4|nr:hypothetical protein [Pseudomonas sp. LS-2]